MHASQFKADLLKAIQSEHTQLESLLNTLTEEQMLRTGVAGSWSVKDVLVHLTWWEQDLIGKIAAGEPLNPDLKGDQETVDHANALIVESQRATPLAEVLTEFLRSYQQVVQAIEGLPDEEVAREEVYAYLANTTSVHYAEHRAWIAAGLRPRRSFYAAALHSSEA
jgi:hypothetical protein